MGRVVMQFGVWVVTLTATAWAACPTDGILQMLGSSDYGHCRAGTDVLVTDQARSEDALVSMYGAARIGEQCHRLLAVARHNLLRRMRLAGYHKVGEAGSIGIAHEGRISTSLPDLNRPAIMVVRTLPGFTAHERLRCGDLVLAVDGHQLVKNSHPNRLSQEFPVRIGSKKAGQTVRLSIFRDQRILDIILPLATARALEEMYPRKIGYDLAEPYRGQWMRLQSWLEALGPLRLDLFRRDEAAAMESDL